MKLRKTIVVYNNSYASGANSFNYYMFTHFQPDEVIVRVVSVITNGAAGTNNFDDVINISSDLVDSPLFVSVTNGNLSNYMNIHYQITQPINRSYNFNMSYVNNSQTAIYSVISFTLEFVKNENLIK